MAHPNEQSIQIVFDHLCETFLTAESAKLVESVMHIIMAKKHKPIHVDSTTHQQFLRLFLDKTMGMQQQLPQLNWEQEINYFSNRI
jgi:2C-methyl-D-erythritol 2,4-cyclodiphosphate synthase